MKNDNANKNDNAIVIFGGGLVDPAKYVLMRIGKNVSNIFGQTFIGKYSFESLYTPEYIIPYDENLIQEVEDKRGTYFGTSRGINLADDSIRFNKAIECLSERNIKTIIVAGGDGSSRQVAETSEAFKNHGINIIFLVPLTVDGINGSLSIGINEATKESIRQIENIASTSLQTKDYEKFGVVIVELQGRNRDDIMANVLKFFDVTGRVADCCFEDITLRVVPANIENDHEKLIADINNSSKRTLILLSEGAKNKNPILSIPELTKRINRKVRHLIVGHPSQSNNMTSEVDIKHYNEWVDTACSFILTHPNDSFSVAHNNNVFSKKPVDYFAKLNPFEGQKAELSEELNCLIKSYMSM